MFNRSVLIMACVFTFITSFSIGFKVGDYLGISKGKSMAVITQLTNNAIAMNKSRQSRERTNVDVKKMSKTDKYNTASANGWLR